MKRRLSISSGVPSASAEHTFLQTFLHQPFQSFSRAFHFKLSLPLDERSSLSGKRFLGKKEKYQALIPHFCTQNPQHKCQGMDGRLPTAPRGSWAAPGAANITPDTWQVLHRGAQTHREGLKPTKRGSDPPRGASPSCRVWEGGAAPRAWLPA